jgi:hypothetical protein
MTRGGGGGVALTMTAARIAVDAAQKKRPRHDATPSKRTMERSRAIMWILRERKAALCRVNDR